MIEHSESFKQQCREQLTKDLKEPWGKQLAKELEVYEPWGKDRNKLCPMGCMPGMESCVICAPKCLPFSKNASCKCCAKEPLLFTKKHLVNNILWDYAIGKNQKENDTLLSTSSPTDIWFHLSHDSSPHLIVYNPDDIKLSLSAIRYFAKEVILAKYKTKKKGVEVMYTQMKNVKKTNVLGQVDVSNYAYVTIN